MSLKKYTDIATAHRLVYMFELSLLLFLSIYFLNQLPLATLYSRYTRMNTINEIQTFVYITRERARLLYYKNCLGWACKIAAPVLNVLPGGVRLRRTLNIIDEMVVSGNSRLLFCVFELYIFKLTKNLTSNIYLHNKPKQKNGKSCIVLYTYRSIRKKSNTRCIST